MKLAAMIGIMRACVGAYDHYQDEKNLLSEKLRNTSRKLKGGNSMKTIGVIVGIVSLIIAGAAAAYFLSKKCGCCCGDEDLYDDFPEEEIPPEEDEPAGWKEESPAAEESAGEPAAE